MSLPPETTKKQADILWLPYRRNFQSIMSASFLLATDLIIPSGLWQTLSLNIHNASQTKGIMIVSIYDRAKNTERLVLGTIKQWGLKNRPTIVVHNLAILADDKINLQQYVGTTSQNIEIDLWGMYTKDIDVSGVSI